MNIKSKILIYLFLVILAITFIVPIYGVIMNSLKSLKDIGTNQWGLPKEWKFENYRYVWSGGDIGDSKIQAIGMKNYAINSFKITIPTVALQLFL